MSKEATCQMPSSQPHAIPILTVTEEGHLKLDDEALTTMLSNSKLEDKPISIVSIAGAFRKGKSFMLNFFLEYLRKGYKNPDWKESISEPLDGFAWRGGKEACTHGILMWSEVFTVWRGDEEIAIILMDTQGLFENQADTKANTLIFALSTLISSVQIFNLSQQIQENDLGFLQECYCSFSYYVLHRDIKYFTSYAKAASEDSQYSGNDEPFQTLIFLIRDWPYGEDGGYGCDGGRRYLEDTVLKTTNSSREEIKEVRKYLRSSFQDIGCCLMPYPGEKVATTKAFNGCLKDIDSKFIDQLDPFLDSLFEPKNLIKKRINGQQVTLSAILGYIRSCSEELTAGKLPNPKTMLENTAEAQNFAVCKFCIEQYVEFMDRILAISHINEKELDDLHQQKLTSALQEFSQRTKIGTEKMRGKHRDYLQGTILREYERLKMVNHSRKVELEKKLLELINRLSKSYDEKMTKETEGKEYLEDKDFDKLHTQTANHVTDEFFEDPSVTAEMKQGFKTSFEERIERMNEKFKKENEEKRQIAKEENDIEKFLMTQTLDSSMKYREAMAKYIESYVEETQLANKHKLELPKTMDSFQTKVLGSSKKIPREKLEEYTEKCKERISDEYREIEEANLQKKNLLKKTLESQRALIYVEYDNCFSKTLKDNYLEPDVLWDLHTRVVSEFNRETDESIQGKADIPIFVEHKNEVKEKLEQRYSTTKEWNEKNNTIFKKFLRVIKTVGAEAFLICTLLALIGKINRTV